MLIITKNFRVYNLFFTSQLILKNHSNIKKMSSIKKNFQINLPVYLFVFAGLFTMASIAFVFPVGFTVYKNTDAFAPFWYCITESGSFIGGLYLFVLMISYLIIYFKKKESKYHELILFLSIVFFAFVFSTGVTEFYIKEIFKKPRPNQVYMVEKGFAGDKNRSFLTMQSDDKKYFLLEKYNQKTNTPDNIYPPIFNNWITETGFSMPSGHAQISYFFGTILSFVIFKTFKKRKNYLFIIPIVWCLLVSLSRVVIGMHYPIDVTIGASLGILLGIIIISMPVTNKIFNK